MNTADYLTVPGKTSRIAITLLCVAVFHAASAKSDGRTALKTYNKPSGLILSLPEDQIRDDNSSGLAPSQMLQNGDANRVAAAGRKKTPLNVDCGMDIFPASNPDTSLSSRLTGECDLKYHF